MQVLVVFPVNQNRHNVLRWVVVMEPTYADMDGLALEFEDADWEGTRLASAGFIQGKIKGLVEFTVHKHLNVVLASFGCPVADYPNADGLAHKLKAFKWVRAYVIGVSFN